MPAYATPSPAIGRRVSPTALVLIIGGHAAAIALLMSAKMDLPAKFRDVATIVEAIPIPQDPPPDPEPRPQPEAQPRDSVIDRTPVIIPLPPLDGPVVDPTPIPIPDRGPIIGPSPEPGPSPQVVPPVRKGPRLTTSGDALRPPYPPSKLRDEEEAALRLKLSIDARGRVTAVEAVGRADPVFLEAARRHLIARWRYQPATEDGRAIASTTTITLRFELEG